MYDEEKPKRKTKKPGQWTPTDLLFGIFGLVALLVLAVVAFKVAKWAWATYL